MADENKSQSGGGQNKNQGNMPKSREDNTGFTPSPKWEDSADDENK